MKQHTKNLLFLTPFLMILLGFQSHSKSLTNSLIQGELKSNERINSILSSGNSRRKPGFTEDDLNFLALQVYSMTEGLSGYLIDIHQIDIPREDIIIEVESKEFPPGILSLSCSDVLHRFQQSQQRATLFLAGEKSLRDDGTDKCSVAVLSPGTEGKYTIKWHVATPAEVSQNNLLEELDEMFKSYHLKIRDEDNKVLFLQELLKQYKSLNESLRQSEVLMSLATLLRFSRNRRLYPIAETIRTQQELLALGKTIGNSRSMLRALENLGAIHFSLGDYKSAISFYLEGLPMAEKAATSDRGVDLFRTELFLEVVTPFYRGLIASFLKIGRVDDALTIAERSSSPAFDSQSLSESNGTPANPLTISDMQNVAHNQNATIVYYLRESTSFLVFVIQPSKKIFFREIPYGGSIDNQDRLPQDLRNSAVTTRILTTGDAQASAARSNLLSSLRSGLDSKAITQFEATLDYGYQLLIQPIIDLLPQQIGSRLMIVPQRDLGRIPFSVLRAPNKKYLIDQYTLSITPSLSHLHNYRKSYPPINKQPLILGNPIPMPEGLRPLPGAEAEALSIAKLMKVSPIIGTQATESLIRGRLSNASLLHFATHGVVKRNDHPYGRNPEIETWLALASGSRNGSRLNDDRVEEFENDGRFDGFEIVESKLNAKLVVLSACDTNRGGVTGEGVMGLARAFLIAGADTVVASLWKVPDQPTALMMQHFYMEKLNGQDTASALRTAMLKVREQYPSLQDWAGFTVIGNPQ